MNCSSFAIQVLARPMRKQRENVCLQALWGDVVFAF